MSPERKCGVCGEVKPVSEFYFRKSGECAGLPLAECKQCSKATKLNRDRERDASKYGLSVKQLLAYRSSTSGRLFLRGLMGENLSEKRCSDCGVVKPLSEYWIRGAHKVGRGAVSWCKQCGGKRGAAASRGSRLRNIYKITEADYERMLSDQNGACFICRRVNPEKRRLAVDHDHKTGKVRGLLCSTCNFAVGKLEKYTDAFCEYLGLDIIPKPTVDDVVLVEHVSSEPHEEHQW